MPKCQRVTLNEVADWQNVVLASHNSAKGKRGRVPIKRYFQAFESSVYQVQKAILAGQLAYGTYRSFTITDPKPRTIHAAPFEDRVIHHALINCIGPRMEKAGWIPVTLVEIIWVAIRPLKKQRFYPNVFPWY